MASMVTDEWFASFRSRRGSGAGEQEPVVVLTISRPENLDRFFLNRRFPKNAVKHFVEEHSKSFGGTLAVDRKF